MWSSNPCGVVIQRAANSSYVCLSHTNTQIQTLAQHTVRHLTNPLSLSYRTERSLCVYTSQPSWTLCDVSKPTFFQNFLLGLYSKTTSKHNKKKKQKKTELNKPDLKKPTTAGRVSYSCVCYCTLAPLFSVCNRRFCPHSLSPDAARLFSGVPTNKLERSLIDLVHLQTIQNEAELPSTNSTSPDPLLQKPLMETQRSAQFEEYLVAKAIKHDNIEDSMQLPAASINNGISSSPSTPLSKVVTSTDDSVIFTNPSSIESQNTTTTQIISNHQQESSDTAGVLETNNDNNSLTAQEEIYVVNSVNNGSSENLNIKSVAQDIDETGVPKPETYETDDEEANVTTNLLVNHKSASTPAVNNTFDFEKNALMTHQNGSYIHDQDSETVLLNTARLRGSARTTGAENFSQANLRNRNSTFTTGSKNVDTATIEIERVRNSIISKREQKKKQRLHLDDDKVLVGNKVGEGHVNYVVAYNMLTGIRVAVSRCSGIMKPLTDQDFRLSKKLVFDVSGNELTPSSKYDFKFKDYCPTVFRELRQLFGLDPADYLVSLTSKYILSELNSPGKSGSFFYFSRDYRFIIKTIHPSEHRQLRRILKEYYIHIKDNPNTLLSQFYGLHRVKMPLSYGMKRRRIYFIVMNNLFPPHKDIQKTFDLKGSTMGRYTNPKQAKSNVVYKDLNWIENKETIYFGPEKSQIFVDQLKKDVKLLIKLRIMDYSFLIGVHDLKKAHDEDDVIKNKKLSVFSPISSNIIDLRNTNPKLLDKLNELPGYDHPRGNIFYSNDGGVIATNVDNEDIEYIYYLGIIDCLTHYSIVKRLETFWRSLNHDRKTISAVPPKEYGERFKSFILHSLNENTLMKAKKQ